jgi:hypothetical protein
MTENIDTSDLACGVIAGAMLKHLVTKGVFDADDARIILKDAANAIGPEIRTERGAAAFEVIVWLMNEYGEKETKG